MSLNRPIWKLIYWIDKDKLNYYHLSENEKALDFRYNIINWSILSYNENAIELLKRNPDKIDWRNLSLNPNAIELLEKNIDKINWSYLSLNPNAIELLEKNIDKINWCNISINPSIFQLDYDAMRKNNEGLYEELIKEVMKPSRVFKNPDYDYIEVLFGD